jgi:hypothetical protein
LALVNLNTPRFRSSASLSRVTRCDHRFGEDFFAVVARLVFRTAVFPGRVVFLRSAMFGSISCFAENGHPIVRFLERTLRSRYDGPVRHCRSQ